MAPYLVSTKMLHDGNTIPVCDVCVNQ
jgi:hypothetical protein